MARKGENIYKRSDGRWEARLLIEHEEDGEKKKYISIYDNSYNGVKNKRAHTTKEQAKLLDKKVSVAQCFEEWLNWQKNNEQLRKSTLEQYRRHIEKHIIPILGDMRICTITSEVLNDFRMEKLRNGRLDGKGGMSSTVVSTMMVLISAVLRYSEEKGYVWIVPECTAKAGGSTKKAETRVFSVKEQTRLEDELCRGFSDAKLGGLYMGIFFALYTGVRVGELGGLMWKDVDFADFRINIRRTLQRLTAPEGSKAKTELHFGPPKSRSSQRSFPMKTELIDMLRNYYSCLPPELRDLGGYVFTYGGKPIEPRIFQWHFKKALQNAGVEEANFHCLRHTFATRCIEHGMDIQSLSEYLGHSHGNITLGIYVHSLTEHKTECINRLTFLSAAMPAYSSSRAFSPSAM